METRKLTCMAAAAFVSSMLIISATAHAGQQRPLVVEGRHIDAETQRVVPYGDLNLANQDGRRALIRRVGYAVNDLCQVRLFASRDLNLASETRTCTTTAWQSANPQIKAAFERAESGVFVGAAASTIAVQP